MDLDPSDSRRDAPRSCGAGVYATENPQRVSIADSVWICGNGCPRLPQRTRASPRVAPDADRSVRRHQAKDLFRRIAEISCLTSLGSQTHGFCCLLFAPAINETVDPFGI